MDYKILERYKEYLHAAKRLDELAKAAPGTRASRELKEVTKLVVAFEKEIHRQDPSNNNPFLNFK